LFLEQKHPAIPFLLILAIADDALGLIILAVFYPVGTINLLFFVLFVGAGVSTVLVLRRLKVASFWPYILLGGSLSWLGFYFGGFHPALALVPIVFGMPHAQTDIGVFEPSKGELTDPLNQFEHWWANPVALILGLFGFANAGVAFTSLTTGAWLVLTALLLGKPIGIALSCALGRLMGLQLPTGMEWKDVLVVGCAASVGFTVALFVSTVAFPSGPNLDAAKMGSLLSFAGILITIVLAKLLRLQSARA
jgi:Na+:H+ antiporter, NhaA family